MFQWRWPPFVPKRERRLCASCLSARLEGAGHVISSIEITRFRGIREGKLEDHTPLVVLVGADWCPACRRMKKILPQAASAGTLGEVEFAYVNTDRQPELADRLLQSGSVPQLIRLEKTAAGWVHGKVMGIRIDRRRGVIMGAVSPKGNIGYAIGW